MSNWTPGPWGQYIDWEDSTPIAVVSNGDGQPSARKIIARMDGVGCNMPDELKRANAHLIAAAPELYEALEACLPYVAGHMGFTSDDDFSGIGDRLAYDKAEAALAKARGETP